MRAVLAWWRRIWHWAAGPPARRAAPAAEIVTLPRRPAPEAGGDDQTYIDLFRVGPYVDAGMRARGTHRSDR